jgi:hypothetical protein
MATRRSKGEASLSWNDARQRWVEVDMRCARLWAKRARDRGLL